MRTFGTVFAISICVVLVLVVLFPVFAHPGQGKDAVVAGADRHPIPGLKIRFADGSSVVTDTHGKFDFPPKSHGPPHIDGLVLYRRYRHTGSKTTYEYSPAMDFVFTVKGIAGKVNPAKPLFEVRGPYVDEFSKQGMVGDGTVHLLAVAAIAKVSLTGTTVHGWPADIQTKELDAIPLVKPYRSATLTRHDSGSTAYIDIMVK